MNGDPVASGGWYNWMLRNTSSSTSNSDANNAYIQFNGGSKEFANSDFGPITGTNFSNQDILIVGRIDFASGQDTGYLSVFTNGEDMQTLIDNASNSGADFGFEATATPTITGNLDQILLRINDGTITGSLRVGNTLAEVGVVPEPSSVTLLLLGAVAMLVLRRRMA